MTQTNEKAMTVLLVDDEEDIRDVMTLSMEDMGYQVLTAENGAEGLEIFIRENPPLVITDIKMPVMDGIELLRRIKRENPCAEVIMVTGHGDMDLAIRSLKNEATDFITKPVNVDALEISLKRACDKILIRCKLEEYTNSLERLVREKSRLQDHLSSLGLMISSVSHGIKGLMTGLDGGLYLMKAGVKRQDLDQVTEGWEMVQGIVERLRKMVMDILFYAKKRELYYERVDLPEFVEGLLKVVAPKAEKMAITLESRVAPDASVMEVDADKVHAALVNILDNAVDACARDSSRDQHEILIAVAREKEQVVFDITDSGAGIPAAKLEEIFTMFSSTKGSDGTGLGLFITRQIIQNHGGTVTAASPPGGGARFTVRLPAGVERREANAVCESGPMDTVACENRQ